jgi:salicylate hydroxylase
VAILGDAAHASTPHQGAGAGQAIEDAYILAEVLSHPLVETPLEIVPAFKAYDAVRRPRSQRVVTTSKENGIMLCLSFDGIGAISEKLKAAWLAKFQWLWNVDLQDEVDKAHGILMASLGQ